MLGGWGQWCPELGGNGEVGSPGRGLRVGVGMSLGVQGVLVR